MTSSKKLYLYIAANLAFLIPVPGRFAYAVILLVLFNVLMATITLLFHAVHRMQLANMRNTVLTLAIVALGIFYKQLLIIVCPIAALTLGYCIFLPMLTSVIIEFFFLDYEHGLARHLAGNMRRSLALSLFMLLFFLFRDMLGYGTITLPGWKRLVVIHLPYNAEATGASVFLATIPGSLGLIAILLALYIFVANKFRIIENAPSAHGEDK